MSKKDDLVLELSAGWQTVHDLLSKFGWAPHTLRGLLSTVGKAGKYKVERRRVYGITSYRLVAAP